MLNSGCTSRTAARATKTEAIASVASCSGAMRIRPAVAGANQLAIWSIQLARGQETAVAAALGGDDGQARRARKPRQVHHRDHRIVGRGDQQGRHGHCRKHVADDRVARQVSPQVLVFSEVLDKRRGHLPQAAEPAQVSEPILIREQARLDRERAAPLGHEIALIERRPMFHRIERARRVEHRADGHDPRQRNSGRVGPRRDAQGEVAAQRKAPPDTAAVPGTARRCTPRRRPLRGSGWNGTVPR
jgi:hypothetical protein